MPRWALLLDKYLGVLAFVAAQAGVFVGGTWLALGLRTGAWDPAYLLALPLLVLHFAIVYAASVLLAVCTRSTVSCAFGSIVFWGLCFAMNYGRHAASARPPSPGTAAHSTGLRWAAEAAYWTLPKPADLVILLDRALQSGDHFRMPPEFEAVQRIGAFHPTLSVAASAPFAAAMLAIAAREFGSTDY